MDAKAETPVIVNPQGTPARQAEKVCQKCGKGPEFRKPQATFGGEKYHCINCGSDR